MRNHKREIALTIAALFISSMSFAIGYLANRELDHSPITIEACSSVERAAADRASGTQRENPP